LPDRATVHAVPPAGAIVHILAPLANSTLCGERLDGQALVRRTRADEATCPICRRIVAPTPGEAAA
jgi:hypothetical protein